MVYEDDHLIVVNKPPGLLSVPGRLAQHRDSVVTRLGDVLVVHRLDMDTSGLMVLARTAQAQSHLSRQFRERQVRKRYQALVSPAPDGIEGEVDVPLMVDWPNRPRQKVDLEDGKPSVTRWQLLDKGPPTRLQLEPVTGRSHQLRLHMAHIGSPILGDRFYGGAAARRLMLHSATLGFEHPADGQFVSFEVQPEF